MTRIKISFINSLIRNQTRIELVLKNGKSHLGVIIGKEQVTGNILILARSDYNDFLKINLIDLVQIKYAHDSNQISCKSPHQINIYRDKFCNLGVLFTWLFLILFVIIIIIVAVLESSYY